jgi:hypothetical protein
MAEAALAEAAKMTGLMRERAQKAEADRDEWIRWSVEQDGVRTDNLIREKERAERAEQRVKELEAERDQYKFLLTESHSSDHYRAEKAEAEAARYRASADGLATEVAALAESNAELTNAATSALRLLREVWVIERGIVARESPTKELERRAGHPLAWWAIRDRLAHALAAAEQEPSEAEAERFRAALNKELEARAVSYRLNPAGRPPAVEQEPNCICPHFTDTGGFRIADLTCPVHGPGGTTPGDGPWAAERESSE